MKQKCSVRFFRTASKLTFFCPRNSIILWYKLVNFGVTMEELFDGQLSFTDIDAEKFLQVRRAHADRRVNAMDRLTDDVRKLFKTSIFERWGKQFCLN